MAKKIVDITEKLSFDENPVLKIKDVTVEVNSDAATVLKIMGIFSKGTSAKEVLAVYELIPIRRSLNSSHFMVSISFDSRIPYCAWKDDTIRL